MLAGYAEPDRREELWQIAAATHLDAQHGAMAGYVLLNARLHDIPPLHAPQAYQRTRELTQPFRYSVSRAAWQLALEFASGHPRLLNRNAPHTDDHQQAAATIETDPRLPAAVRTVGVNPADEQHSTSA